MMKTTRIIALLILVLGVSHWASAQVKIGDNALNQEADNMLEIENNGEWFMIDSLMTMGRSNNKGLVPSADALMLKLYGYGLDRFIPSAIAPTKQHAVTLGTVGSNVFAGITTDGQLMEVPLRFALTSDSNNVNLSLFNGVDTFGTEDLTVMTSFFASNQQFLDSLNNVRTTIEDVANADDDPNPTNELIDHTYNVDADPVSYNGGEDLTNMIIRVIEDKTDQSDTTDIDLSLMLYNKIQIRNMLNDTADVLRDDIFYLSDGKLTGDRTVDGTDTITGTPGNEFNMNFINIDSFNLQADNIGLTSSVNTNVTSGDELNLTSENNTNITSNNGDVNISDVNTTVTSSDATTLTSENNTDITSNSGDVNITDVNTNVTSSDATTLTSTNNTSVTSTSGDINMTANSGVVNINSTNGTNDGEVIINADSINLPQMTGYSSQLNYTGVLGFDSNGNIINVDPAGILSTQEDSVIYKHDGTLSGERTMTMGGHNLFFVSTSGTDTTTITPDGHIAIGRSALTPNSTGPNASNLKLDVAGDILAVRVHSSSDRRFKKNITPIESALEKVMSINGVTYDFRVDEFKDRHFPTTKQVGFIAQNVEEVLPQVVATHGDGYKAVDYAKVTALLTEAMKEQQKQIEDQNQIIAAQQAAINEMNQKFASINSMLSQLTNKENTQVSNQVISED